MITKEDVEYAVLRTNEVLRRDKEAGFRRVVRHDGPRCLFLNFLRNHTRVPTQHSYKQRKVLSKSIDVIIWVKDCAISKITPKTTDSYYFDVLVAGEFAKIIRNLDLKTLAERRPEIEEKYYEVNRLQDFSFKSIKEINFNYGGTK